MKPGMQQGHSSCIILKLFLFIFYLFIKKLILRSRNNLTSKLK